MKGARLWKQMTQVFAQIERRIIPSDEKLPPGRHLFSVSVGVGGFDCEEDETAYCQRINVPDGNGSAVQVVLACGCAERPEWAFLLHYLVDAAADRLRIILLERKEAFLLGSDFCFSSSKNRPEDADTVARACLSVAYHQIAQEMASAFQLSFDVMDQLSLTNYEQEGAEGVVLVAPREQIDKSSLCIWQVRREGTAELSPEQTRFVRKLLAGSAPDALLFAASPGEWAPQFCGVVSLTKEGGLDEGLRSNCVQVSIRGPMNWELSLFGQPVCLRYHTMGFRLPRGCGQTDIDQRAKDRIEAVLREEFDQEPSGGPFDTNICKTVQAVLSVRRQAHGAAAVVAAWRDADNPCRARLETLITHQKAIQVAFKGLPDDFQELANAITEAAKMDGAVLIDAQSGEVCALAVILDGLSCIDGVPSRGARFNSLKNFTATLSGQGIVSFVFSSDGGMDIFSGKTIQAGEAPPPEECVLSLQHTI